MGATEILLLKLETIYRLLNDSNKQIKDSLIQTIQVQMLISIIFHWSSVVKFKCPSVIKFWYTFMLHVTIPINLAKFNLTSPRGDIYDIFNDFTWSDQQFIPWAFFIPYAYG